MSDRTHTEYIIEVRIEAASRADAETVFEGISSLVEHQPEPDVLRSSVSLDVASTPHLRLPPAPAGEDR